MVQGSVVNAAVFFGNFKGFPAHLNDKRLRNRKRNGRSGHSKRSADQARNIHGGAREGHRGVNCQGNCTDLADGVKDLNPVRSRGVNDQLRGPPRAKFPEAGHQSRELVIRNSQENHFAAVNDLFYGQDGDSRE